MELLIKKKYEDINNLHGTPMYLDGLGKEKLDLQKLTVDAL